MNTKEFNDMMAQIVSQLSDHCDGLRIFMTRYDSDVKDTESYTIGYGNFHAQIGLVKEWIQRQDQYVRENAKSDTNIDEEEQ